VSLDRAMRDVCLRLEMCSAGTTYSYNGSGGGVSGSRDPVSGDASRPAQYWATRYVNAPFDRRQEVFQAAVDELAKLQGRYERPPVEGESPKQWKDRMIREGAGFDPQVVALRFNTTPKMVVSIRLERQCFPQTGKAMVPPRGDRERVERVRELSDQGATMREIGAALEISAAQVCRIVKNPR
jgi:hypothetical protein